MPAKGQDSFSQENSRFFQYNSKFLNKVKERW